MAYMYIIYICYAPSNCYLLYSCILQVHTCGRFLLGTTSVPIGCETWFEIYSYRNIVALM